MYHSNNPSIVEIPDDIDRMESMSFVPGEVPRVTVTFVLKDTKKYANPTMLFATNGVEHRLFAPTMTLSEHVAQEHAQVHEEIATPVEPVHVETQQQQEEPAHMEGVPKRGRSKKSSEDAGD